MELLVEYDLTIEYVKGKENMIVDALSRKKHIILAISRFYLDLLERVRKTQLKDSFCVIQRQRIQEGLQEGFSVKDDDCLYFGNRIVIPIEGNLHKKILYEAHVTPYSTHPSINKIRKNF